MVHHIVKADLKACPFCGAEVQLKAVSVFEATSYYEIQCADCFVTMIDDLADVLIADWNRRTSI